MRSVLAVLVVLLATQASILVPASAQERVESLVEREFPMVNQPARHALPLVDALLSGAGTVSFEQEGNMLVIKDRLSVLDKLKPLLAEFDHPLQELILELHLLRASRREPNASQGAPPERSEVNLPKALATDLSSILSLNSYEVLGFVKLDVTEGEGVVSNIGQNFEFSFDVGTVLRQRYVKLADFRVVRAEAIQRSAQSSVSAEQAASNRKPVFRSTGVNLEFDRPAFITVSRDASSASGLVMAFLWSPVPNSTVSPPRPSATRPAPKVGDR